MFSIRVDWGSRILLLALLFTGIETKLSDREFEQSKDSTIFTDQWAVHVNGGDRVADDIAARHGFVNFGKVLQNIHRIPAVSYVSVLYSEHRFLATTITFNIKKLPKGLSNRILYITTYLQQIRRCNAENFEMI